MKLLLLISILCSISGISRQQQHHQHHQPRVGCPISDNPSQVFQCLTLNPQAFVDLISKNDFKSFCHMANGYMTCMSTYIRDCLLGKAASGILEELQDLNLKCCISGKSEECVIKNPTLLQKCFSADSMISMANGTEKSIMDINLGDVVKAIDSEGNLIDSEIVSVLHKDIDREDLFQVIYDVNESLISLSSTHMINIKGRGYVHASEVKIGDNLRIYSDKQKDFIDFTVKRISFESKRGYIAPLTNEGTILVNKIDASCFAVANNHYLANVAFKPVKLWYMISKFFGQESQISDIVDSDYYTHILHSFATNYIPSIIK